MALQPVFQMLRIYQHEEMSRTVHSDAPTGHHTNWCVLWRSAVHGYGCVRAIRLFGTTVGTS